MTPPLTRPMTRAFLTWLGIAWIVWGVQVWSDPDMANPDMAIWHTMLPIPVRVALWVATGTVAVVCSRRHYWWPAAFAALTVMPVERAMSYSWSALMWVIPGPPPGHCASTAKALWWWVVTVIVTLPVTLPLWQEMQARRRRAGED